MKQKSILLLASLICGVTSYAQIGYQVSLLNSATGEPRANETVSVSVAITNSEDTQIFSSTQSATTNDFGVLSLQIGNSTTFDNVDWSKLPLFISATVDGVMVGKSQILNVPVAEAAKRRLDISLDDLCDKNWWANQFAYYKFYRNGSVAMYDVFGGGGILGTYEIYENMILVTVTTDDRPVTHGFLLINNKLFLISSSVSSYSTQI